MRKVIKWLILIVLIIPIEVRGYPPHLDKVFIDREISTKELKNKPLSQILYPLILRPNKTYTKVPTSQPKLSSPLSRIKFNKKTLFYLGLILFNLWLAVISILMANSILEQNKLISTVKNFITETSKELDMGKKKLNKKTKQEHRDSLEEFQVPSQSKTSNKASFTVELKLAPAVKRLVKCSEEDNLPEPLCEDGTSVKLIGDHLIVGYLVDAAPGKQKVRKYDGTLFSSRLHAKLLGETFIEWAEKKQDLFKMVEDGIKNSFEHFLLKFKNKMVSSIDFESLKTFSTDFQVSFTGFLTNLKTRELILFQLGDTTSYVATDTKVIKIPKLPATFTKISKDKKVSIFKKFKVFNLKNVSGLLIASDGVMDSSEVDGSQDFCKLAKTFKESNSNTEDDKSLLILSLKDCNHAV